ncbi:molybdenum cofactor guanylyltransferase MobA [Paragemmobacter ruber]|uniref:Molybdenum cofactor guanylyltransferase n=1 Tax=Paragemmobacter ruber TaxID=1985673 RepID=A0ABW9Y3J4_9RHOB|nr:molybdenum cofactor guanylyltransferase MobA [Rhodobacter ruber]NBE06987.1 molybdenum cofactor guanylyltransferase [Rhodobacter ruber]
MRIFGVILAGGQGRRMGGADKALLPLAARPLIAHAADRLEPQVERLALSANGDPARLTFLGLPVLPDARSEGPLSGILAALDWAAPLGATAVVSAPVDAPFLPPDLVPRLILAGEGAGGVAMARSGGNDHPTFGLWPVALRDPLRAFLASGAKARVRTFADAHNAARADFADDGAFTNLNTPEDLAAAAARIGGVA